VLGETLVVFQVVHDSTVAAITSAVVRLSIAHLQGHHYCPRIDVGPAANAKRPNPRRQWSVEKPLAPGAALNDPDRLKPNSRQ